VMDPHMDVLLLLQAHDSKKSQEFYKYIKRACDRLIELGIKTVRVAKFDVEKYVMPAHIAPIQYNSLPSVLIFPAKDKEPPHIHLTGKAKVNAPPCAPVYQCASQEQPLTTGGCAGATYLLLPHTRCVTIT
jgi:hypothetical protein